MTNPDVHGGAGEQAGEPLPDLAFAEPNAIDRLRVYHRDWINGVRDLEVGYLPDDADDAAKAEARQRADGRVAALIDDEYDSHVKRGTEDMQPELRDRIAALLPQFSYRNMSDEEWNHGLEGPDGERQPSGRVRLQEAIDAIKAEFGGDPDDDPEGDPDDDPDDIPEGTPDHETLVQLHEALVGARNKLARLSVQRQMLIRKGSKKAQELETQYNQAKQQYDAANLQYCTARAMRWRVGLTDNNNRVPAADDATVLSETTTALLEEHQRFSRAEYTALQADDSGRARFARFLIRNRLYMPANFAGGMAIGFGARWISRGLLAGAMGIAAPAALAAGAAVKTTRAVYEANIGSQVYTRRHFEKFRRQDHEELQEQLTAVRNEHAGNTNGTALDRDVAHIRRSHSELTGVIDRRVEKSRKKNLQRVGIAALVGAGGGLAGEFLEAGVEHLHLVGGLGVHNPHLPGSGGHEGNGSGGNGGTGHGGNGGTGHGGNGGNGGGSGHNGNGGNGNNPGENTPGGSNPNNVDGYNPNVHIASGEGYEQALADLAHQKGIHMSEAQNWALYQHLNNMFHGNFLSNDPSYRMDNPGQWGISHAGGAHWNPAVVREMNDWLNQHDIHAQTVKKTAKVARRATRAALAQAA